MHNTNSSSIVIQDGQDAGQTVKVCIILIGLFKFVINYKYSILKKQTIILNYFYLLFNSDKV